MAATADTAKLLASLDLQDNMSPKLRGAVSGVQGAETAVGRLGTRLSGFATSLRGGISSALTTFTGRLKQFATAGLGILGIGGAFAIGKTITDSIAKAKEFGLVSQNLAELLHAPIEQTSRLADTLDYFGIHADRQVRIMGMLQKNLGILTTTNKTATAFEKQFGLSLRDSNGHVITGYEALLRLSDYWRREGIPQQEKIVALNKMYGKGWQELLPLLRAGRAEIEKQFGLAMHLTPQQLADIKANETATRDWQDALGDIETQIGIHILPTLTDALRSLSKFVNSHSDEILEIVDNIIAFGKGAVSTIVGVAEELGGIWDKIPKPFRDFISGPLLKLALGEKVIKFLFGVSPVEIGVHLAKEAFGGLLHGLANAVGGGVAKAAVAAGIGKAFVQPVWVTNPGFGGGGLPNVLSGAAGAAGAGAAAGTAATLASIGIAAIGVALIPYLLAALSPRLPTNPIANTQAFQRVVASRPSGVAGAHDIIAAADRTTDAVENLRGAFNAKEAREQHRDEKTGAAQLKSIAAADAITDLVKQQKNAIAAAARLAHQRALTIASRMETHLQSNVHVTVNTRVSVSDVRKASYSSSSAYDTAVNTFGNKIENIPFD